MNKGIFVLAFFFLASIQVFGQSTAVKWSVTLETPTSFIENRTQFDGGNKLPNSHILFAVDNGATHIYFTKKGLTYRFDTFERMYPPKGERTVKDEAALAGLNHVQKEREEKRLITTTDLVHVKWTNANSDIEIIGLEKTHDHHNYSLGEKGSIDNVPAFKKLVYKSVYPNIDVAYVFHPEGGIKYSFILHPGADPSNIKMEYSSVDGIQIDAFGNVHFPTMVGDIIEHAPVTFYADNASEKIDSRFVLEGNTLKLQLADFDPLRKVILDPWVQTPTLAASDAVWECESDAAGNVYIIGGETPLTLQKYNVTGALQWTYNTPYDTIGGDWLGTLATDDVGNSYVSNGSTAALEKINTGGVQQWGFTTNGFSDEFWTISFNCDQTKLIIGGTGGTLEAAIFDINTVNGGILDMQIVAQGSIPNLEEVRSLTSSKNSRYYFLTHSFIGAIDENFSPCFNGEPIFRENSGYDFGYKNEDYRPNNGNAGIKAIRANDAFVYTVNGTNVQKRSLADGAIIATVSIPGGGSSSGFDGNVIENAGIDIDDCGNVYVGSGNAVHRFDADLNLVSTESTAFSVYDVEVSSSGEVIVAGATGDQNTVNRTGYVQSFNMGSCEPLELICCDPNICPADPLCTTDAPITLVAGSLGGTWTGNGITNASTGIFNPSVAGIGTHMIVYTLQCGADSIEIVVSGCVPLEVCLEANGDLTALNGAPIHTWQQEETVEDCSTCFPALPPLIAACSTPPGCAVMVTQWVDFATGITVTPPSYPVRVVDAAGDELIITDPNTLPPCEECTPPTLATTQQDVNCAGGNDGAIDLTVTGTSTYDFDWDNAETTEDISNLIAGDYTVIVTDQNDQTCTATETVTILEGGGPEITGLVATDAACGALDGEIDITATGATQYSIDGGTTFQPTGSFAGLVASPYDIVVQDANGCQADSVISVENANGPTIDNVVVVDPNCGALNGSIDVTATGAAGYSIDGGTTIQTTGLFTGLGAGTYDIAVGDLSGCLAFEQVVLSGGAGATIDDITTTDPACGATDGSIIITASGGTDPLNYSIDNGLTTQATGSFTGLAFGTYDIIVNDPSNCPVTQQVVLNSNGSPSINNIIETDATCGASDGEMEIIATGGVAPLQYSIDNGATFQTGTSFTGLAAGNFDIVVQDDTGCQTTATATISNSGAPVIANVAAQNATCNGVCDGGIVIVATGATQYSIDGGTTFEPLPAFIDLCAADYDIVVDDGAGCQSFDQITITEPAAITASTTTANASCSGMCDGAITITASGGIGALTYSIDNGTTSQTTGSFANVCDGAYAIIVEDADCQVLLNETVSVPNPILFMFSSTDVSCFGACNGTADVNAQGGTAPYSYNWSGSAATSSSLAAICAGTYTLTITDDAGCSVDTTGFPIVEPPMVSIDNVSVVDEGCAGDCDGVLSIASQSAALYSIDGGLTFDTIFDFTDMCPSIYNIVVQDANGCEGSETATITAGVPVIADFTPRTTVIPELKSTIQFANNSSGASIYTWHFGDGTYSSEENPTYDFANQPGTYLVCLSADNGDGCIDTTCNYIDVTPLFTIYVPNAFTPNGSKNINDVFVPVIRGELEGTYTFSIFNRWGEQVFETNNLDVGWDGTFKDRMAPVGVYVWTVVIERDEGGKNRRFVGHVTLL